MPPKFRQEVLNVLLAQLLQERGIVSAPETILKGQEPRERRMPDVIVTYRGLRTTIEGEIDKSKSSKRKALESATRRVEENVAHIGVAVVYDKTLVETDFTKVKHLLSKTELEIAIVTESGPTEFVPGTVDYLETALRNAFEKLILEDVVNRAVTILDNGIERFAGTIISKPGDLVRLAEVLGISFDNKN